MRVPVISRVAALACGSMLIAACGQGGPASDSGTISNDKIVIGVLNDQSGVY